MTVLDGVARLRPIMLLREFVEFHRPALERDEVRHNLMLGLLARLLDTEQPDCRLWTLGAPGACAIQTTPRHAIILGDLDAAQCRAFAEQTRDLDYPGVVGTDGIAPLFVARAVESGAKFAEPIPELIQALRERPSYPQVRGTARLVRRDDAELFAEWLIAFFRQVVPHEVLPTRERIEMTAAAGNYRFWVVDGEPVAMAGIVRRSRHAAAIAGVFTPPALRNRGYGAAVTAAVVDAVFAEGRTAACLYTDLRNPASNRCYAKIGFKPVCRAWHYLRA
jgi:RimJ/RimL family protein N-acetyltransferase